MKSILPLIFIVCLPIVSLCQSNCWQFYIRDFETKISKSMTESDYFLEKDALCKSFSSYNMRNKKERKEFAASARARIGLFKGKGTGRSVESLSDEEVINVASSLCQSSYSESDFASSVRTLESFIPLGFAEAYNQCIALERTGTTYNLQPVIDSYGRKTGAVFSIISYASVPDEQAKIFSLGGDYDDFELGGAIGEWWNSRKPKNNDPLVINNPMNLTLRRKKIPASPNDSIIGAQVVTLSHSKGNVIIPFEDIGKIPELDELEKLKTALDNKIKIMYLTFKRNTVLKPGMTIINDSLSPASEEMLQSLRIERSNNTHNIAFSIGNYAGSGLNAQLNIKYATLRDGKHQLAAYNMSNGDVKIGASNYIQVLIIEKPAIRDATTK